MVGLGEPVLNSELLTLHVAELDAVVGEHDMDLVGGGFNQGCEDHPCQSNQFCQTKSKPLQFIVWAAGEED